MRIRDQPQELRHFGRRNNIYNSLLTITPPPELKVVPELAKSWEVLDEGKT